MSPGVAVPYASVFDRILCMGGAHAFHKSMTSAVAVYLASRFLVVPCATEVQRSFAPHPMSAVLPPLYYPRPLQIAGPFCFRRAPLVAQTPPPPKYNPPGGTGAAPGQDPTPKGGGGPPPPSTDPKIVARNKVLCRRRRRRRFCFRHTAGGIFLVPPYVSILKILRILWRIQKWLKSTKKVM